MMTSNRRSALHFVIFLFVAVGMTIFILGKAQEAVREIEALSHSPVYRYP